MKTIKIKILTLSAIVILLSCNNNQSPQNIKATQLTHKQTDTLNTQKTHTTTTQKDTSFANIVEVTIEKIKNKKFAKIKSNNIRFSPTANLSEDDKILDLADINSFINSDTLLIWGKHPASGEYIKLNFNDYFKKYVYDYNYASLNAILNHIELHGNNHNNIKEIYPSAFTAQFYFEGTNENEYMDWSELFLIFTKQNNGNYKLIAIVHNAWTP